MQVTTAGSVRVNVVYLPQVDKFLFWNGAAWCEASRGNLGFLLAVGAHDALREGNRVQGDE